jgi:hypothetical protein
MTTGYPRPRPSWAADPRVEMLAAQVAGLAADHGRPDLARSLEADVRALASRPPLVVVVAGGSGSGKSTLVNALMGRRVLPIGVGAPTTGATVLDQASLDHPLLAAGLRLVDSPGLDDHDPERRAVAVDSAARADAMLFLLDPEAPLSSSERRFLEETSPAPGAVIFVVAKADVAVDLEAVVAADRELLAGIATRWAQVPLYVVSAREKLLGDEQGDGALARESGVQDVEDHLRNRLLPHPRVVRSASVVQRCRSLLGRLEAAKRHALHSGDEATTRAEAAVAAHRAYVERSADWGGEFARDYQRHARQVIERDLRMRLLERRERRDVSIRSGGVALEEVTAAVKADLAAVAEQIQSAFVERVAAVVGEWAWRLELPGVHLPRLSSAASAEVLTPASDVASATWHAREVSHRVSGVVNMARSAATGRALAGILPGGLVMGTGLGIVLTGLTWGTSEWLRTKVQDQQGAIAFVQASYARAQIELEAALREHAVSLQPVAQAALQQGVEQRRRGLAEEAARLQQEAEQGRSREEAARAEAASRLAELEPWSDLLDELAERFSTFLRTGSPIPRPPAATEQRSNHAGLSHP